MAILLENGADPNAQDNRGERPGDKFDPEVRQGAFSLRTFRFLLFRFCYVTVRYASLRFVSFRFESFRFVMFRIGSFRAVWEVCTSFVHRKSCSAFVNTFDSLRD